MEAVVRAAAIYLFLLVLFRLVGQRTLSELTTFDFILLLIVSEAAQNALVGDDFSVATGVTVILTVVMLDVGLSIVKKRFDWVEKITEGTPLVIVDHGKPLHDRLAKTHVSESDILQVARQAQGLERMDQIKYAVLETSGGISVIPMTRPEWEGLDRRIEQAVQRALKDEPRRKA
ncbi:MAG: YetF domain-containing protein [Pseudomonadota bacterium]